MTTGEDCWNQETSLASGIYEQDNNTANGKEPISWRVLDVQGSKALVISEKNLDCLPYHTSQTSVTWEICSLRAWLNGEFLNAAFTAAQQGAIATAMLKNENNPTFGTEGGRDTQDRVFLLSIAEAKGYFTDDASCKAQNTAYAKARGADDDGYGQWWLRSPDLVTNYAAFVIPNGFVFAYGTYVYIANVAVRPALWIDLFSDIFKSSAIMVHAAVGPASEVGSVITLLMHRDMPATALF